MQNYQTHGNEGCPGLERVLKWGLRNPSVHKTDVFGYNLLTIKKKDCLIVIHGLHYTMSRKI